MCCSRQSLRIPRGQNHAEIGNTIDGGFPHANGACHWLNDPGMTAPEPVFGKSIARCNKAPVFVFIPKPCRIVMALAILAFPHIAAAIKEPAAFKDFWCIFIEHRHADFIPAKCEDFVMQLLHSIERLSIETRRGVVNLAFGKPHFPILVHWVPMNRRGHLVRGRNRFQTVPAFRAHSNPSSRERKELRIFECS